MSSGGSAGTGGLANLGIGGTLTFNAKPALTGMQQASNAFASLTQRAVNFGNRIAAVGHSIITLGGPLGQLATAAGVVALGNSAIQASEEFETLQTVLGTTLSVVGKMDIASGVKLARIEMEKIEELAVKAPGSSADLLNIYKQIVSPMAVAGKSLDTVRELTLSSAIAAQSLGLNFQDMGFGLGKMLSGTIQQDDLFYKMLRGMGLIKVGSMEWNAQTPVERIEKANALLAEFGKASDVVGSTWAAIKSTFGDVLTITKRALIEPLFQALKGRIGAINDSFMANKEAVRAWATDLGKNILPVFDGLVRGGTWVIGFIGRLKPYVVELWGFITGVWNAITTNLADAFSPLNGVFDEIWQSLRLLWNEIMGLFGTAGEDAKTQGTAVGSFLMTIVNGAATVLRYVGKAISFVVYFVAHTRYLFELVGTRIGEVFGMLFLHVKNTFASFYNAMTEPVRAAVNFIRILIETLASTTLGKAAFKLAGIDATAVTNDLRQLTTVGILGKAEVLEQPGFGHVETPEERLRKADERRAREARPDVKVDVTVKPQDVKLQLNGKTVADAVVRQQMEVKERAGANDTPWQRRASLVRAAPAPAGG